MMVPTYWLTDKAVYKAYKGRNRAHEESYAEAVEISKIRIDRTLNITAENIEYKGKDSAVVFMYKNSSNFIQPPLRSVFEFDGKTWIVVKVIPTFLYSEAFSYEVEVVIKE